jgi:hypothetical protein
LLLELPYTGQEIAKLVITSPFAEVSVASSFPAVVELFECTLQLSALLLSAGHAERLESCRRGSARLGTRQVPQL